MAIITAARYNTLQSTVANVMGNGAGQFGYGQVLASSQVAADTTIDSGHMSTLYTDLINARVHQVGSVPNSLASIAAGDVIEEDATDTGTAKGILQYEDLATLIETNKDVIYTADTSQSTITANKTNTSRTASWSGIVDHIATVTFASADVRRHFFNAGGTVRFASNITYVGSSSKTIDWMTMLVNMGTVSMNYTSTTATGSGSGSAIGYHDLDSSYQQLFEKTGSGLYAANDYKIEGSKVSATVLRFKVTFNDDNTGNPNTDENVEGVLNSTITQLRPTGAAVEVASPNYSTNGSSNLS